MLETRCLEFITFISSSRLDTLMQPMAKRSVPQLLIRNLPSWKQIGLLILKKNGRGKRDHIDAKRIEKLMT